MYSKHLEQWSMIPLRVKIIQLLLREYMIVQEEEKMAQEGGEDEGEDDDDVSKQIHIPYLS